MARDILITGGGGYIGLKLARVLLEQGHRVSILDNFVYGVEPVFFLFHYHPNVSIISKDIRNIEHTDVADYDCVYHLAGISGYPACEANPHSAQMINVGGTDRLVSCLSKHQLLIYASTTSIYGCTDGACREDSPVHPASLYAVTKYEGEKRCLAHPRCIAFRFATIFGVAPRMRWDLMPNDFVMRAVHERSLVLFDARSTRTFLHVDDAVEAYLLGLKRADDMAGRVYNVGSASMNLTKLELAEAIKEHIDFAIIDSDLVDPDVRNFRIDFDKISALGYSARKPLDEGIRELIALFRVYRPMTPYKVI